MKTTVCCNYCLSAVTESPVEEYPYECMSCDKDLYSIETHERSAVDAIESWTIRKLPRDVDTSLLSCPPNPKDIETACEVWGAFEGEVLIGMAWMLPIREKQNGRGMFLEFFEVVEKGRGHGRRFILYLLRHFGFDFIRGIPMYSQSGEAFHFWHSMGATYEEDKDLFEEANLSPFDAYLRGLGCEFILRKEDAPQPI